jgi:hypothetical protein
MFANLAEHLDQAATVYDDNDDFSTVVRGGLACRLVHVDRSGATAGERAELMTLRDLMWDPEYVMPEGAQVEIDGVRWQTVRGTFGAPRRRGEVAYRICQVERVTS